MENKERIVKYISQNGKSKASEIAEAIGLSQPRTRVLLSELITEGQIEANGEARARVYIINS